MRRAVRVSPLGSVDELHGFFGEVATVGDVPLVVDLQQHGADQAQHGGVVREDPDERMPWTTSEAVWNSP